MEIDSDMDPFILFIIIVVIILVIQLFKIGRYLYRYYFDTKPNPNQKIFIPLYQDDWEKTVKTNIYRLNQTKNDSCSICLEPFTKQKITSFSVCGKIPHLYCQDCILDYGKTIIKDTKEDIDINCPLCKTTIWTTL